MTVTPKPVIGLIGGIGAGKSTVAAALVRFGGKLLSGDPLGHEALKQPDILAKVAEIWGARGVLDEQGQVDRKKLGSIVFPSPVERTRLEHLVHPYIEKRLRQEIECAQQDPTAKFIILDAAVMLEAGWNDVCDKLVFVDVSREVRLSRVQAQRGWNDTELANREAVQMPTDRKKSLSDAIIDNNESPARTQAQIEDLVQHWKLG